MITTYFANISKSENEKDKISRVFIQLLDIERLEKNYGCRLIYGTNKTI